MRLLRKYLCAVSLIAGLGFTTFWALQALSTLRPSGTWTSTASLSQPRAGSAAALLDSGDILVTGGEDASTILSSVERYGSGGVFSSAPPMTYPRRDHTITRLDDGRLLAAGGISTGGAPTATAEVFSVVTGSWSTAGGMSTARSGHTATLLSDGRVLIAGGSNGSTATATLEVFDPVSNTFSVLPATMSSSRTGHGAATLWSGAVVIVGGSNGAAALQTSDIFDPETNSAAPGASLSVPRANVAAAALIDGKVLVAGGSNDGGDLASAEVYDPVAGTFGPTGSMSAPRSGHSAILLPQNGGVLIVGGSPPSAAVEIYQRWTGTFVTTGSLAEARAEAAGAALAAGEGRFLAAGGSGPLGSAELYNFATVATDKDDYAPGQVVTITGSGWQPGETVTMVLKELPKTCTDRTLTAVADASGVVVNTDFVPEEHHFGVRFFLTASGQNSGEQAHTTFTDARQFTVAISPTSATQGVATNYTLTVTNTSTLGELMDCVRVTIPTGAGTPTGLSVVATDPAATARNWGTPTILSGTTIHTTRSGGSANSIDPTTGTVAISFTATSTTSGLMTWTTIADGNTNCSSQPFAISGSQPTVTVDPAVAATTVSVASATGVYGGTAAVSATLTQTTGGAAVSGKTIDFTLNGNPVGSAVTNASGVASIPTASLAGINAATYPSGVQASFAGDAGFSASNGSNTLTVNAKDASVTPNPDSKTYGDPDPTFTGTLSGFLPADGVTATYSRTPGETVAGSPYTISATLSPMGVLGNYNITYNTADFNITPKDASVTPNPASKTYGDPDPTFTGTLSGFLPADGVTATYSRTPGETVAGSPYTISATLSPMGVLGNYNITYNTADFNITPKDASVTPNPGSKVYGQADPVFTGTLAGFLGADGVTATYSRTAGELVLGSPYIISATLSPAGVLDNYNITYNTADFNITPKDASVTPNASSKTYGDPDPVFTGTLTGFLGADGVTATYSRAAGETVLGSPYTVSATLNPVGVLGNYNITYNTASFIINVRPASVTPNPASKFYGDPEPALTGTLSGFIAADGVTATYTRTAGETVAGSPYTISTTLVPIAVLDNYSITYNTANFIINPRPASVTPNAASKPFGTPDPPLTGTLTGFLAADGVTATYSRTAGDTVGPYTISATLSPAGVLGNYSIIYNTAVFTITVRPTSTVLTLGTGSVKEGMNTGFTILVTDILGGIAPAGTVTIGPNSALTYASISCISGGSTQTCTGTVTGKDDFNGSITANYLGSAIHAPSSDSKAFVVTNVDPAISGATANPTIYTSAANITVSFTDVGVLDTHTCSFDGPVSPASVPVAAGVGSCSATYPASPVGVYPVTVTVTDDDGGSDSLLFYVVFYDPEAGFVTGGGWINSPLGAYYLDTALVGKATFGFVSKYKKGATLPEGNTEFQFHAAGMNFKSTSYDYLVVQGQSKAQYKGNGTINGAGDYKFMVSVVDGQPDKFRIKITEGTNTIYDNMLGALEDADPTTALGGGSIVIHTGGNGKK